MTHDTSRLHDPTYLLEQDARLRALARRLVLDSALADDVVQDTWLHALRGARRVETRLGGWLTGIARHVAFGKRRDAAIRTRNESRAVPPPPAPSTEELLAREAARRAVADAVMQLAEPARAVVVLRFFDDLPPRAIAARFGEPVETVRTRLKRALEQLRRELDRKHGGDGRAWLGVLAPIVAVQKVAAAGTLAIASVAAALVLGTLGVVAWDETRVGEPLKPVDVRALASNDSATDRAAAPIAVAVIQEADPTRVAVGAAAIAPVVEHSDVTGHVVDDTGSPIEDARVSLALRDSARPNESAETFATTVSDKDGRFAFVAAPQLGGKPDDSFRDTLVVEHALFVTYRQPLASRTNAIITLPRPARLRGTVRSAETHEPIAGVPLVLYETFARDRGYQRLAQATADGSGRFEFLAPRRSTISIFTNRRGCLSARVSTRLNDALDAEIDVFVPATTSLTVEVRDAMTNDPLANIDLVGWMGSDREVFATTGSDGRAVVQWVPTTGAVFAAVAPENTIETWVRTGSLASADPGRVFPILIARPWTVRGVLVDPSGAPIAGVSVARDRIADQSRAKPESMARAIGRPVPAGLTFEAGMDRPTTKTNDDGSFVLSGMLPGTAQGKFVMFRNGGQQSLPIVDCPAPGSDHDLGRVTMGTKSAMSINVSGAGVGLDDATIVAELGSTRETWTKEKGEIVPGHITRRGVEPGTWTLTASAPGFRTSEPQRVVAQEDYQAWVQFTLEEDDLAETTGQAIGVDGAPEPFAIVGTTVGARTYAKECDAAGRFALKTPRGDGKLLRLYLVDLDRFPVCIATAKPGDAQVVVRRPERVTFSMRFVDSEGQRLVKPVEIEWNDGDRFRQVPFVSGYTPPASGIFAFDWPAVPLTLRVRRAGQPDASAVIVDVDVRENDAATAPVIAVP